MPVPFEQIGGAQLGRLVYQVIGKDGPIYNPKNIRYLDVDELPARVAGLGTLPTTAMASAGSLGLLATAGTLLVGAETLRRVVKLQADMRKALAALDRVEERLGEILVRAEAIDAKVEENNLRHALTHVQRQATGETDIDLEALVRAEPEIRKFIETICNAGKYGAAPGLVLSADVVDLLNSLYSLALGLRYSVADWHNRQVDGASSRVVVVRPSAEESDGVDRATTATLFRIECHGLGESVADKVYKKFMTANKADRSQVLDSVNGPLERFATGANFMDGVAFHDCISAIGPSDALEPDELASAVRSYFHAWHSGTHMGLAYRTMREMNLLATGYEDWVRSQGVTPVSSASGDQSVTFEADLSEAVLA